MNFGWLQEVTNKPLFNSAAVWAAFGRLMAFIESIFKNEFGEQNAWPDSVTNFYRATYRGEYDNDFLQLSAVLPSSLDRSHAEALARAISTLGPLVPRHRGGPEGVRVFRGVPGGGCSHE